MYAGLHQCKCFTWFQVLALTFAIRKGVIPSISQTSEYHFGGIIR